MLLDAFLLLLMKTCNNRLAPCLFVLSFVVFFDSFQFRFGAFNKFSEGNLKLAGGLNGFRIRWLLSFA